MCGFDLISVVVHSISVAIFSMVAREESCFVGVFVDLVGIFANW